MEGDNVANVLGGNPGVTHILENRTFYMNVENNNVVILGSGIAGLGAAQRLHSEGMHPVLYEKNHYPGGNTASFKHDCGFYFDEGGHVSFTKNKRIEEMLARNVNGDYEVIKAHVNNHWRGHWIKHPAPCNLHGLPTDLVVSILRDFVGTLNGQSGEIRNYADWLLASYGKTFAETFPMEYTRKYHTTTAENMTTVWLGQRLYRPSLEEMLHGALNPSTSDVHYVSQFRYPRRGGFVSYIQPFIGQSNIRLSHKLIRVNPKERILHFQNGTSQHYWRVISSLPLPELIALIEGAPKVVVEAAQQLACTTSVVVNLGVAREDISAAHWTYFYDQDISITRMNFPHMLSPNNAPKGCGSIQAEVYYSKKYRPLNRSAESHIDPVIQDLKRCGLLREEDRIVFREAHVIPYANIIFDHDRETALPIVLGFLEEIGIATCGRYGEWGYLWTDDSFISGEKAAQKVLDDAC